MDQVFLSFVAFSFINLTPLQRHRNSRVSLIATFLLHTSLASILRITHHTIRHHLKMETWNSNPDETWGAGGDGATDVDGPTVAPGYGNVDGFDIGTDHPVNEDEKKPQRIRKKDIEQ